MPEKVALNLRLPTDLHERLRQAAFNEDRSLNNLIVHVLREWEAQRSVNADERKAKRDQT